MVISHSKNDFLLITPLIIRIDRFFLINATRLLHREFKQTCGFARCLANTGRAQRNHIGLSLLTRMRKRKRRQQDKANNIPTSMYQQKWEVVRPAIQAALAQTMRA